MDNLLSHLDYIQEKIGYVFNNNNLLIQAFTRSSYAEEHDMESNEVFEKIGDEVLSCITAKLISDKYGEIEDLSAFNYDSIIVDAYSFDGGESFLSDLMERFVNGKNLAKCMEKLGLAKFLLMNKSDIKNNVDKNESTREDLFEAIIGAIAIDNNWDFKEIEHIVADMLFFYEELDEKYDEKSDYINLVQIWNHKVNGSTAFYKRIETDDGFIAKVPLYFNGEDILFVGKGKTFKDAKKDAARKAYKYLELNGLLDNILDYIPEDLNLDNAINVLQELSQKGFISIPKYSFIENDALINKWTYTCEIIYKNKHISEEATENIKKTAKKHSAYKCLCKILNRYDVY